VVDNTRCNKVYAVFCSNHTLRLTTYIDAGMDKTRFRCTELINTSELQSLDASSNRECLLARLIKVAVLTLTYWFHAARVTSVPRPKSRSRRCLIRDLAETSRRSANYNDHRAGSRYKRQKQFLLVWRQNTIIKKSATIIYSYFVNILEAVKGAAFIGKIHFLKFKY